MPRKAKSVTGLYEHNPGSGIWYVRYRLAGKLVRKKIGPKEEAKDYLEKLREARTKGGVVPTSAKGVVKTTAQLATEAKAAAEAKPLS